MNNEPLGDSRPEFYIAEAARERRKQNEQHLEMCILEAMIEHSKPLPKFYIIGPCYIAPKPSLLKRFFKWIR